ncbi:CoA pyrophosphatase [Shewanella sp. GXUN23E]|uniref:CoA pyrophosphatase n=1 Tax=Shewanella sp. GXUN23E TaxID=3422498 RepID=UPI003D7CDD98
MNAQEFRTRFMVQRQAKHHGLAGAGHERQAAVLISLWQPPVGNNLPPASSRNLPQSNQSQLNMPQLNTAQRGNTLGNSVHSNFAYSNSSELQLILTRRASHLNAHPGQISFPGGKRDQQDISLTATALREATEEIALPASQVEVLGKLPVHHTITGFAITPVIGLVSGPFEPVVDPGEVAECFTVPWRFLLNPANRHLKTFKRKGHAMELCFIPWQDKFIWGATAAMIDQLCRQMASH